MIFKGCYEDQKKPIFQRESKIKHLPKHTDNAAWLMKWAKGSFFLTARHDSVSVLFLHKTGLFLHLGS